MVLNLTEYPIPNKIYLLIIKLKQIILYITIIVGQILVLFISTFLRPH